MDYLDFFNVRLTREEKSILLQALRYLAEEENDKRDYLADNDDGGFATKETIAYIDNKLNKIDKLKNKLHNAK